MNTMLPHLSIKVTEEKGSVGDGRFNSSCYVLKIKNIGTGFAQRVYRSTDNIEDESLEMTPTPVAVGVGEEFEFAQKIVGRGLEFMGFTFTYSDAFGRNFESSIGRDIMPAMHYGWRPLSLASSTPLVFAPDPLAK